MVKLIILVIIMKTDRASVWYIDICERISGNDEFVVGDGDTISQSDKNFIIKSILVRKFEIRI